MISLTAKELSNEKTIGWFQGRMEFGPRALGGRSILADPRSDKMQKNLILKLNLERVLDLLLPQYYEKMFLNGLILIMIVLICFWFQK